MRADARKARYAARRARRSGLSLYWLNVVPISARARSATKLLNDGLIPRGYAAGRKGTSEALPKLAAAAPYLGRERRGVRNHEAFRPGHDPLVVAHRADRRGAHLVERVEREPAGAPTGGVSILGERLDRAGAPRLVLHGAGVARDDPRRARCLEHAGRGHGARPQPGGVAGGQPVPDGGSAVAAYPNLAGVEIPEEHPDQRDPGQPRHQLGVLGGAAPRRGADEQRRMDRRRLQLRPVDLVGVDRLEGALPRPDLLVEDAEGATDRMQVEIAAEPRRGDARPPQERRRLDRTARCDDRAGANGDAVAIGRYGRDAAGASALQNDALGLRAHHDPGAGRLCVDEPGPRSRLLRPERAAVAAVAADAVVVAAMDVAGHAPLAPAAVAQAAADDLRPLRQAVVVTLGRAPRGDGVECAVEGVRLEHASPLGADLVRGPKRRREVHDRAAPEARAGEDPDSLVVRRGRAAPVVEAAQAVQFRSVEVGVLEVAADLEHDHVEAGLGEHGRRYAAARARSDDADVAVERRVTRDRQGSEPRLRRPEATQRAGIADALPGRRPGQGVRDRQQALAKRLEAGPPQRDPAVAPREESALPPVSAAAREAGRGERRQQRTEPAALGGGEHGDERLQERLRDAGLYRAREQCLGDGVERPPLGVAEHRA